MKLPKGYGENRYHRYIRFPGEITRHELCKVMHPDIWHADINPYRDKAVDLFHEQLGLKINHVEIFYTPPGHGRLPIHTDTTELLDRVKMNITWGPPGGVMRWWESNKTFAMKTDPDPSQSHRSHKNLMANEKDSTMMYEADTGTCSLVNAGRLHDTYNPHPTEGRWTMCFVPEPLGRKYLTWDEALDFYKDYII